MDNIKNEKKKLIIFVGDLDTFNFKANFSTVICDKLIYKMSLWEFLQFKETKVIFADKTLESKATWIATQLNAELENQKAEKQAAEKQAAESVEHIEEITESTEE